jgi:hypothetical protein
MSYREKVNLYSKLEVQFNMGLFFYEDLKSNSDEVKFIACSFVLHLITFIILLLEYNRTDFPSHQS